MNFQDAHRILAMPLVFGDDQQIEAKEFIERVNAARDRVTKCRACGGLGVNRKGYHCTACVKHFDDEIIAALGIPADEMPP